MYSKLRSQPSLGSVEMSLGSVGDDIGVCGVDNCLVCVMDLYFEVASIFPCMIFFSIFKHLRLWTCTPALEACILRLLSN